MATIGLQVAQGLSYAHSQAVLHRDIKPSNLLLDTRGTVWITDFGLAKVEGSDELTKPGDILGTLRYMAPERFEGRADARGDLYSLGTTLYELLTLHPTFEDSNRARLIERIAHEQPLRPRRLDPHTPRDLETIVLKAIAKEPADRFQTAAELAAELERFLADRPIKTHRSSAVEHVWRWCRRNPQIAALAAAVVLALVVGIAGTTWGMIRAQKRLAQLEKATDILASVFRDLDPQAAEKEGTTMHDLLARRLVEAARQLEGEAVGDPLVVARIQHALGISLRDLCYLEQAEAVLVKACQTRERLLGADHLDTAATKHDLAMVYRAYGKYALDETKYPLAETLYKEALAVRTAKLGADHPDTLSTRHHLAILYYSQEKYAVAETLHKQVLAARTARLGAHNPDTLTSQHWLGLVYRFWGNYAQAETLYKEVLAARIAKLGADHLDTIATKGDLAMLYRDQGKYAQAETLCQEVLAVRTAKLGPDHLDTLHSQDHLALVYHSQRKYAQAEKLCKEVLAIRTAKLGADHLVTLLSKHHLARLYRNQQKYALAETLYKEVVALRTAKLAADHPVTLDTKVELAWMYLSMRRLDLSISLLEETVKLKKAKFGPDNLTTLATRADLGVMYREAGRFDDAIPLLREVYQKSGEYPELGRVGDALIIAYLRAGKEAEVIALAKEQVGAARKQFSADSSELAGALAAAGEGLLDAKAYADAEAILRECLAIRQTTEPDAWTTFDTQSLLGAALLGQKKSADAESLLVQGYAGMKSREAQIPKDFASFRLAQALERVVRLYEANGPKDKADEWRRKLADQKK